MALTNFAALTTEQKTIWSMDLWKAARNYSFLKPFMGKDANSMIQQITELKKSEKGARAVITLLADLEGDGVVGDRTLEGNEEAMKSFDQVIRIDQMRHANRHEGRMADQKSVVEFRENSKNVLAYWLAERMDQLAFLTLSGVSYAMKNNGVARTASAFPDLEFAADITAPTSRRKLRWNAAASSFDVNGSTSSLVSTDTPSYKMLVAIKAFAKDEYIRGIKDGGDETYHAFLTPQAMAKLKIDPDYIANLRYAQSRGSDNELFTGGTVKVDGIFLHEYRNVYNTTGATSGVGKWGAGSNVEGCQMLFCGAQALGIADIGSPEWVEKGFDYENQQGISVSKIMGLLKPRFNSIYAGNTVQDFGVISAYVAQ